MSSGIRPGESLFIRPHDETLSVAAVCIENPDRSSLGGRKTACQLAVFSGKLPSMETEIDCKLQSNCS